ncbi:MAG: hypothetical protein ACOZCO_13635 [Bacteroidota bacterium]
MKFIISFLLINFFFQVNAADFEKDLKAILEKKKYDELELHISELNKSLGRVDAEVKYHREIVPGFSEGLIYFEKSVPDKKDKSASIIFTYRLRIITNNNLVIFYDFSEQYLAYAGETDKRIIKKYKSEFDYNDKLMRQVLQDSFKNTFPEELRYENLFCDTIVYGHNCGLVATETSAGLRMKAAVEKNDKPLLLSWLQSGNTELQLYAVEGLYLLKKNGTEILPDELKMIRVIKNKKGEALSCSGDILSNITIYEALKDFVF